MDDENVATLSSRFVSLVGRRWTVDVLTLLAGRGQRYQEIHEALDGVLWVPRTPSTQLRQRSGTRG
jgi:DNA-binding HxlR family transcriptional regulator